MIRTQNSPPLIAVVLDGVADPTMPLQPSRHHRKVVEAESRTRRLMIIGHCQRRHSSQAVSSDRIIAQRRGLTAESVALRVTATASASLRVTAAGRSPTADCGLRSQCGVRTPVLSQFPVARCLLHHHCGLIHNTHTPIAHTYKRVRRNHTTPRRTTHLPQPHPTTTHAVESRTFF